MTDRTDGVPHSLFVGAPTQLGNALNGLVREQGAGFRAKGIAAVPNKIVTHAIRSATGDNPDRRALDEILELSGRGSLFLSGLYSFGRPATAFRRNALFPQAERMLMALSHALDDRMQRVVVAIEPVQFLLFSAGRDEVLKAAQETRWDVLYEVCWGDLVEVICDCFPHAEVAVLTPHATANGAAPLLHYLFGNCGFEMAGEQIGARFLEAADARVEPSEIKQKTGLDRVAFDLLLQRFEEDVSAISRMSRVRVF